MNFNLTPTSLIDQLRAWFHPKDRSVFIAEDCFIDMDEQAKPSTNPAVGRDRLYPKAGNNWYVLDSTGTETLLGGGSGLPMHTHANNTQGGQLDWDNIWSDAVHDHSSAAEGGVLPQDAVEVSKLVASDGAPDPALSADASGYLTAAVQPLFSAYVSNNINNVTGDGTLYTIIFDTETVDRNSNFNTVTGTFSMPVTGTMLLLVNVNMEGITSSHTSGYISIATTSYTYYAEFKNPYAISAGGNCPFQIFTIAPMSVGDTAIVKISISNGAKVADVTGGASLYSYFQGYLLP